MEISGSDAVLFALAVGLFALGLIALTAVLSIARQGRAWKKHRSDSRIRPPKGWADAVARTTTPVPSQPASPKSPHTPRLVPVVNRESPVIPAPTPADSGLIQITPAEGPTRDQKNVRRIIAYLKQTETNQASSG